MVTNPLCSLARDYHLAAKNKTEKARKAMEKYLANHPYDAYACSKLGGLYLSLGEVKKGIKLLKTGLKHNSSATPDVLYELHYHLGNAMVEEKQFTLAEKYYQKAIQIPIAEILKLGAYLNYGSLCHQRRQYQRAIEFYNACIRIAPNYALAYYNLGLTYKAMGNIPLAIESYRQAIRLNPNCPWAYQNLAVLLFKQGYIEESASLFKTAYHLHQKENPSLAENLKEELKSIGIPLEEA
ncbi:MAG: tetratricopeptide repeat protein [Geminocystis sp.]|nr:tetratricopeptide repeat protein [Geminocystis sp.]MDW8464356.1 tetratricopeptide repeat protein [Geminocystis sp.]